MNDEISTVPPQAQRDIRVLGNYLQNYVDCQTEALLSAPEEDWQHMFEAIGDMAYGKFNERLFQPLRQVLVSAGLKPVPRLPGSFQSSREWGNHDESHQQRWFTSRIVIREGAALGTIAVGSHHDHLRFRLPRSPEIIALEATKPREVVAALSAHRPEYGRAQEFREWYADYLAAGG